MAAERAIGGLDAAKAAIKALPDKLRRRALRLALAAGGRVVRDEARRHAPVIDPADPAVQRGWRKPGTVRDAIVVRTSKQARREGNVGVFVNVRPAKGAKYRTLTGANGSKSRVLARASQRGAKVKTDPFYWRFLEFGTKRIRAVPFLRPAAQTLDKALAAFTAKLGPQAQRILDRQSAQ